MQESKALHYVLGLSLALIALFVVVALVMINTRASDTEVTINNVAPTVVSSSLDMGATVTLTSGTTTTIHATGQVGDQNGQGDIPDNGVQATLYRSSATNAETCTPDDNDCYRIASCPLTNDANPNRRNYDCTFNLAHYTDSTTANGRYPTDNWKLHILVKDTENVTGSLNTTTTEVADLLSLNFPTTINFGAANPGDFKYTDFAIDNKGNIKAGVYIYSTDSTMDCTTRGAIPRGNQEYSTASFTHGTGTDLTATTTSDTGLLIDWQATATLTTDQLFMGLAVPEGVEGVCSIVDTLVAYPL